MNKDRNNITEAWKYYELGRSYNNSLHPNQYTVVNTNIEFFTGNQWRNLPQTRAMAALPKPVFNIIKRVTSLFVASLTSSGIAIRYEPLSYYGATTDQEQELGDDPSVYATAEVQNLLEKFKMEYKAREALFDGAQTGDYCAHFYWDPDAVPYGGAFGPYRGEIQMELVDGINVMFGNPNTRDVEKQPYVLIVGRDNLVNLQREREKWRRNGAKKPAVEDVLAPDSENTWQAGYGGKHELTPDDDRTGKALYVILYTKKVKYEDVLDKNGNPVMEPELDKNGEPIQEKDENGVPIVRGTGEPVYKMKKAKHAVTSVHVTKATRSAVIYEDIDTGLTRYPIAWGNWERQKNQYHGRALVTGLIPNQIFINSMFAMVMRHLQLMGFPKTIYNQDLIGQWNNEIGQAIGVRGLQPGQAIGQVAANLQTADMSAQIIYAIDKAMEYTRECMGATDVQMGNVKPDNTSAIMVMQSNAEVPLENTRALLYEWVEDVGAVLLDMMGTYYGKRPIVRDKDFEEPMIGPDGVPQMDPMTGQLMTQRVTRRVAEEFDFSQLKKLWFNVRCDVGATTFYSEIAMVQTMDNLRREGTLDIIDYLERIPDKLIPQRAELIVKLKRRALAAQQAPTGPEGAPPVTMGGGGSGAPGGPAMGGELDTAKRVQNMPQKIQDQWNNLPTKIQNSMLKSGAGEQSV